MLYCTFTECDLTKQFRCGHSISCFSHTKLCDGIIDCWDGYDEVNCTTGKILRICLTEYLYVLTDLINNA